MEKQSANSNRVGTSDQRMILELRTKKADNKLEKSSRWP